MRKSSRRISQALILLIALLLFLFGCGKGSGPEITLENIKSEPGKLLSSYEYDLKGDLASRVKPMPDATLSMWKKWDRVDNYSSYTPTPDELLMVESYISLLPPLHRSVCEERLVAIYFVHNFVGSGAMDFILDENDEIYLYAVFHPATLKNGISKWVTYRESTCFELGKAAGADRVEIDCGDEYSGFMYILLHELTHAVDYIENVTPYLQPGMEKLGLAGGLESTAFTAPVWRSFDKPLELYDFDRREKVSFYGLNEGPKLQTQDIFSIYEDLSHSAFVSLYASMNWAEDLAELVTWYHFTKILKQPYEIGVYRNNRKIHLYRPMDFPEVKGRFPSIMPFYKVKGRFPSIMPFYKERL
jgi:hypothetical protein